MRHNITDKKQLKWLRKLQGGTTFHCYPQQTFAIVTWRPAALSRTQLLCNRTRV